MSRGSSSGIRESRLITKVEHVSGWRELASLVAFLLVAMTVIVVPDRVVSADVEQASTVDELQAQLDYDPVNHGAILRLYRAIFGREPDVVGAKYWIGINRSGFTVLDIAGFMSGSTEWSNNYAGTSDEVFVERVYMNVLGRAFDQEGYDYWLDLVKTGQLNRPGMVFYVTLNQEFEKNYPFQSTAGGHIVGTDLFFGHSIADMSTAGSQAAEDAANDMFADIWDLYGPPSKDLGLWHHQALAGDPSCEDFYERYVEWGPVLLRFQSHPDNLGFFLATIQSPGNLGDPYSGALSPNLIRLPNTSWFFTGSQVASAASLPGASIVQFGQIFQDGSQQYFVEGKLSGGTWTVSGEPLYLEPGVDEVPPPGEASNYIWASDDARSQGQHCPIDMEPTYPDRNVGGRALSE